MNEMEMENGKRIYVGRAQRKIERQGELRDKFEKLKEERLKRYQVPSFSKSPIYALIPKVTWVVQWNIAITDVKGPKDIICNR